MKHIRVIEPHKSHEFSEAHCDGPCSSTCPRHNPGAYADMMARHATDSILIHRGVEIERTQEFSTFVTVRPEPTPAERFGGYASAEAQRFHTFGITR